MKEKLIQLGQALRDLVNRFENSGLFEKLALSYESQDKNIQKIIKVVGISVLSLLVLLLLGYPLITLYKSKTAIQETRELISLVKELNYLDRIEYLPSPSPRGHKRLSVKSPEDLMSSFRNFLGNHIGVAKVSYNLRSSGKDVFLNISELTIRQAYRLVFQIDGWHSNVMFKNLDLKAHPKESDLLQLSAHVSLEKTISKSQPIEEINNSKPPPVKKSIPKSDTNQKSLNRGSRNSRTKPGKVAIDRNRESFGKTPPIGGIPTPTQFPPDSYEDEVPPELIEEMEADF